MISIAIYGGLCAVGFTCLTFGVIWSICRAISNSASYQDQYKSLAYPLIMIIGGIFVGVFFAILVNGA